MKAIDILKEEDIHEDDCGVCKLHEEAYKKLTYTCPHCNKPIEIKDDILEDNIQVDDVATVVGEVNYYDPEQNVELMPTIRCKGCHNHIGLKLIPIIYNGNHDIYYTGGKDYLATDSDIKMTPEMKEKIQQYTERIKSGENLDTWNLVMWLESSMQHKIASELHKRGLKF